MFRLPSKQRRIKDFLVGGGRIFKNFRNFCRPIFFGRPEMIFRPSQSTKKTVFWSNFLRRRQNFEKQAKKKRF